VPDITVPEPAPAASAAPLLILASASPRRSALLAQIGVRHHVVPARIEERRLDGEAIEDCARRLAEQKALKVYARQKSDPRHAVEPLPVLGADTVVAIEGSMLGKPRDRDDALEMLARLSGQEHEVISAVALAQRGVLTSKLNRNVVRFRALTPAECETYWDSGEPRDKAGAYAIQGRGAVFIDMLRGSYSGVMGLPLFETAELLTAAGLPVWQA
jgi:septum formation protein